MIKYKLVAIHLAKEECISMGKHLTLDSGLTGGQIAAPLYTTRG